MQASQFLPQQNKNNISLLTWLCAWGYCHGKGPFPNSHNVGGTISYVGAWFPLIGTQGVSPNCEKQKTRSTHKYYTIVYRIVLTSYSCLKPYPSAVFIWLMCWRRSATLTAGWSWPVWYGELFLRQWRWGEPPSKLLDSLTELRCSSGNMNTYSSRHAADIMHPVTRTAFFFY